MDEASVYNNGAEKQTQLNILQLGYIIQIKKRKHINISKNDLKKKTKDSETKTKSHQLVILLFIRFP